MLLIEMNPNLKERWPKADFGLSTGPVSSGFVKNDICTFCTARNCETPPKVLSSPISLAESIRSTLPDGVRAMVGNAGCELTFRHMFGSRASKNIRHILRWAKSAYSILGERLVLAPMDFDLLHDVMTGGRLLAWAAANKVPLVIFCGYRFVFQEDEFEHIKLYSKRYDFGSFGNPYKYPFGEISDAIKASGAEVWTGAGFEGGLLAGVLEKAERFGFGGVLTTRPAWEKYFTQPDLVN